MRQSLARLLVGLIAMSCLHAQGQSVNTPSSFAGGWSTKVSNHEENLPLTLKIAGSSVSGTFNAAPIAGEVKDGQVVFADLKTWPAYRAGTIGSAASLGEYSTVYFARISGDGSLTGTAHVYIRGAQVIQRMTWTAQRVPDTSRPR